MYMIKSNGGSGTVENLAFNNFMGHSNAYTLDFDTAWASMDAADGDGINYSNISFSGWSGTCADGTERGPIKMNCPAGVPCTDITVEDFSVWTDTGDSVLHACQNAYGRGACLNTATGAATAYSSTQTVTASAAGGAGYSTMANELTTGWDVSSSIPIPTMPASFYPGRQPISAILNGGGSSADTNGKAVVAQASSTAAAPTGNVGASGNVPSLPSATGFVTRYSSAAAPQPTAGGQDSQGWGSFGGGWRRV
jgi:rhamnogalacturonan hydrolase